MGLAKNNKELENLAFRGKVLNGMVHKGIVIFINSSSELHPVTKRFVEFCGDNSITIPLDIGKLDVFVRGLDNVGTLSSLDILYLLLGSADFGTVNLINPEKYRGTAYGGLIWDATGVTGNHTNGYIRTGFNPSLLVEGQKYQLGNAIRGGNVLDLGTDPLFDGVVNSAANCFYLITEALYKRINQGGYDLGATPGLNKEGFVCIDRLDDNVLIKNDDLEFNFNFAPISLENDEQTIMRIVNSYSDMKLNLYFMGGHQSSSQLSTFSSEFNTLIAS